MVPAKNGRIFAQATQTGLVSGDFVIICDALQLLIITDQFHIHLNHCYEIIALNSSLRHLLQTVDVNACGHSLKKPLQHGLLAPALSVSPFHTVFFQDP